ncbi:guanine nucleotide-binding protein G(o) subunit alpha-like isoform X2 [Corticium candelabrum]|uniref:guanine nucleotide-binding protein G(o) subunit alpha-like isoform X2 n=1 Tax=Corticium candelabrum TaxID=121492 RepID=UPI002E26C5DC|nr:guanine nucleotide-binding protein G(o) subunit alpha-like isoform X2 [Corticium candelabrum]
MGCALTKAQKKAIEEAYNAVEENGEDEQTAEPKELKLLLLGAGESGKTTIRRQIKLIYTEGFSNEEKEESRPIVFSNTVQSLAAILKAMGQLRIPMESHNPSAQEDARLVLTTIAQQSDTKPWSSELVSAMKRLWADQGVHRCYERNNEYQLNDSAKYYLDSVDRISHSEYVPNEQDILRTRVKSTGVVEMPFIHSGFKFNLWDVGGQRSERKKWIHCFQNVDCVLFCVALSAYNQTLREDSEVNRLQESLRLFGSILNNRWFASTSIMLILNKRDLFEQKIKESPLTVCFPEYQGGSNAVEASAYIQAQFELLNKRKDEKDIYTHLLCATDTNDMKKVLDSVLDITVQNNLHTTHVL